MIQQRNESNAVNIWQTTSLYAWIVTALEISAPLAGDLGAGGERFSTDMGFPGTIYSPNITPHNLKEWTDGEIFRAITSGVNKYGKAIFS